ncbi:NAD(P)/FAD-dependent oxidoreductase [Aureimonas sp. AU22]|uniref:NAD(P)/FAD-dependent oxidoreductase n=1 Tax=Aureimonas sp. AU22 TaxID=1638162 RepID=UPI0007059837|nr:NAD(P)/FAD-dependent oxidoreductase [Aureimonas sp. AU22]BAT30064.1 FAD-dependent pyridine nucleotide-disulfide oxidoreductase [Aureimonas sp. AU22]
MRHDAIVVGGSFAGLSAATYIARGRRSVVVVDAGIPHNRFAAHSHGFLAQDGSDPGQILATAREQLAAYGEASLVGATAIDARPVEDGFAVTLDNGLALETSKLVLAFGVADILPDVPGVAERWGRTVLHCPYCHGYEISRQRLGVLYGSPRSAQQAMLIAEWGPTTLFLDGQASPDADTMEELVRRNVFLEPARVIALVGEDHGLVDIAFEGGRQERMGALFIGAPNRLNSDLAERLGCAIDDGPLGPVIRTDADRMTSVPGVYAAGDIARAPHSVTWAASDGVTAGIAVHRSLAFG